MSKQVKKAVTTTTPENTQGFISNIKEFDRNGNLVLEADFSGPGLPESKIVNLYDDQNRLIEKKQYTEGDELADHQVFFRNQDGQLLKTEVHYPDGSKSIIVEKTDGRKSETIEEDEDGELESKEVNHFNKDGLVELRELYDFNHNLVEAYTFEYNEAKQLVRRDQLDRKKKLFLYTLFEYDQKGRNTKRANFNRKGKLSDFLAVEFDENDQIVKQNFGGKFHFIFGYDQNGNTILEERLRADGEMEYRSTFEYDEEGRLRKEVNTDFIRETTYEFH